MWKRRDEKLPEGEKKGGADLERYLLNLLSRGILPTARVREKLAARGASPEETDELVLRFSEAGYLDDGAYALLFVDSHRDWGPLRLRDELRRRGMASSFIREALSDVDEEARAALPCVELGRDLGRRPGGEEDRRPPSPEGVFLFGLQKGNGKGL